MPILVKITMDVRLLAKVFTKKRYIIETVVSEYDVKHLLTLIYQTDPDAFTTISNRYIRGRFFYPLVRLLTLKENVQQQAFFNIYILL